MNNKFYLKKNFIAFIIGAFMFSIGGVLAVTYFPSISTKYDGSDSGMTATNVQSAIDELYQVCSAKPAGEKLIEDAHLTRDSYECRYFFEGYNVKNYVTFNNELWQVLSVECDGTVKIINYQSIGITEWDSKDSDDWTRPASLNSRLSSLYYSFPADIKNKIVAKDWNIGDISMSGDLSSIIRSESAKTWRGYIALPTVSEYLRTTGNESKCGSISLNNSSYRTCKGSTWMAKNTNWWMLTPRTFIGAIFFLDDDGIFVSNSPVDDSYNAVGNRAFYTLYLSADVKITGGDGSQSNPYTIE